jgi:DNA-binding NarL/FixJ family response regulator
LARKVADDYFRIARGTIQTEYEAAQVCALDHQILALLAQGLTDEEIGPLVNRAPKTVGHRLDELRGRLGAKNRPHLVHLAHQLNLIRPLNEESLI